MAQVAAVAETKSTKPGIVWKRAAALFVACMVAVGVLALGLIAGVIPVQLGISKNPFTIHLERLEGTKITAYVGNDIAVDSGNKGMAIAGVEGGTADSLCLTTDLDLPFLGIISVKITSGRSESIPLDKMVAMGSAMNIDDVTVRNLRLGVDASRFSQHDLIQGPDGSWGLEMDGADVDRLRLDGEKIKVVKLRLRGLGLGLKLGEPIRCH